MIILESILHTIKQLLGIATEYRAFDPEIIMHINSVLMILTQLGVGPKEGFEITGGKETWSDYLGEDEGRYKGIRSYIFAKVKLMFDTAGLSGAVLESLQNTVREFEWRLNVQSEEVNDDE